ncbi:MAG: hypothetical protein COW03_15430 [Cytophagales bacterium CG12_big_fil_rev_8_21_14_0_65_40_12]|nr:MAG: hypothetical protein COW03_15430 [Cytophagales bacterium CG12_big_fil_rev_8_21_14_0_65_40_12]PIW04684.1 MAG: hypothetical protein COW40_08700 [Cytophagales bacterium CG17_big_fil_post_rev_8_21_14_2_50_40_13]
MFLHAKGHPSKSIIFKKIFNSLFETILGTYPESCSPHTKKIYPQNMPLGVFYKKRKIFIQLMGYLLPF